MIMLGNIGSKVLLFLKGGTFYPKCSSIYKRAICNKEYNHLLGRNNEK